MTFKAHTEETREGLLVFERRLLMMALGCGLLSSLLFIISFSSEFWVFVELRTPQSRNDTRGKFFKTGHYHGLWKICRMELWNSTNQKMANEKTSYLYCRPMYFTLPSSIKPELRAVETQMLDLRRSTIAIDLVCLLLSILAHIFTWYSLGQLRYMFKRLAACLQLITGVSCWITIEFFRQSIKYEELNMKHNVPEFSYIHHGWSYNLLWVCLVMFTFSGVVLIASSQNHKGLKARSFSQGGHGERGSPLWKDVGASKDQSVEGCGLASAT